MTNSENNSLFKMPGAWIPLVMSFAALVMILIYVAMFGTHAGDGACAAGGGLDHSDCHDPLP